MKEINGPFFGVAELVTNFYSGRQTYLQVGDLALPLAGCVTAYTLPTRLLALSGKGGCTSAELLGGIA